MRFGILVFADVAVGIGSRRVKITQSDPWPCQAALGDCSFDLAALLAPQLQQSRFGTLRRRSRDTWRS
jgi:hypothetical protein